MYCYSILDKVSKTWSAPFVMANDETAIRSWKHDCQKVPAEYLPDYELYKLGSWNSEFIDDPVNGCPFNPVNPKCPCLVFSGSSLVEEEQKTLDFEAGK